MSRHVPAEAPVIMAVFPSSLLVEVHLPEPRVYNTPTTNAATRAIVHATTVAQTHGPTILPEESVFFYQWVMISIIAMSFLNTTSIIMMMMILIMISIAMINVISDMILVIIYVT